MKKQNNKVIDCLQNHQDSSHPNGCIVLEDFNGGEGFYKLNLDYLNKKQVEEIEEMVRTWNTDKKELKKINSYCEKHCKGYQETSKCFADGECEAKRKAEQNIAWSEEDKDNLTDTCVAIRKFYHGTNGAQELIDWIKSLKNRIKGE